MDRRRSGQATYVAPPNIALIKYWGVRDVGLVLPNNDSFSVTLDRFFSRTRVRFGPAQGPDAFRLNGRVERGDRRRAVVRMLDEVRARSGIDAGASVTSRNNFPTASGLASSASGFAALAGASAAAARLPTDGRSISRLARLGSGSACRSVFGGFVEWKAGHRADGRDCFARPRFPAGHWPGLVDLVGLVEDAPVKSVRSAVAMQSTVATSPGYPDRLREIPGRLRRLLRALRERDEAEFFTVVIEECDSFRSVCESTRPSLDYLTPPSRRILAEVREANREAGTPIAAYTHDAGAHVHVFTTGPNVRALARRLRRVPRVARWISVRPGPGGRFVGGPSGRRASR
ncbi:MAG TPA: diphosphomevalonate decarboxylase, partial [Thermoplasmata archaeon]|nr:diphosphomevalonate decarboxylase [Thermoplasmata archaeon]